MATNPFPRTEERVAPRGLAARLVRNADPRTDPNDNVHRLPTAAPANLGWRQAPPEPAQPGVEFGERLGRWAVLALFALTLALAGVFLVAWLSGGRVNWPVDGREPATAQPASLRPDAPVPPAAAPPTVATSVVPATPPAINPAPAAPAPAGETPVGATARLTLSPAEVGALLSRGDALLNVGDVAAARPLLERAALADDATAALRLGQSYDPAYLADARLREAAGNLGLAIFWYRRGQELGNGTAAFLARKLETAARAGWSSVAPDQSLRHRPPQAARP